MTVPARHLHLLREKLEADHVVSFKNGAQVEFEDCPLCGGAKPGKIHKPGRHPTAEKVVWVTCPQCEGEGTRLRVEGTEGRILRFLWPKELERAYTFALHGSKPVPQPKLDPDYGGDAPW